MRWTACHAGEERKKHGTPQQEAVNHLAACPELRLVLRRKRDPAGNHPPQVLRGDHVGAADEPPQHRPAGKTAHCIRRKIHRGQFHCRRAACGMDRRQKTGIEQEHRQQRTQVRYRSRTSHGRYYIQVDSTDLWAAQHDTRPTHGGNNSIAAAGQRGRVLMSSFAIRPSTIRFLGISTLSLTRGNTDLLHAPRDVALAEYVRTRRCTGSA